MANIASIKNFTRSVIPKISSVSNVNIANIKQIPEIRLKELIRLGAKNIAHVDMNHCAVATIRSGGIDTIFTDGLNGCSAVAAIFKTRKNEPIVLLSHYVPTSSQHQADIIGNIVSNPALNVDPSSTPRLFFNIRGKIVNSKLEPEANPVIDAVQNCVKNFFKTKPKTIVTPYEMNPTTPFTSHANILQFNTATNTLKITNVGEKEVFFDLII